jgi:CRISPR-associated protein Csm2
MSEERKGVKEKEEDNRIQEIIRTYVKEIIKDSNHDALVTIAEELGKKFAEEYENFLWYDNKNKRYYDKGDDETISTSQIRNIFSEAKQIQIKGFEKNKNRFKLLKPKLKYAAAKAKKKGADYFADIMTKGIDLVDDEKKFENFMNFFESILAYHKAYGGK